MAFCPVSGALSSPYPLSYRPPISGGLLSGVAMMGCKIVDCPLCYSGVRGRKWYPGHRGRGGRRASTRRLHGMGMLRRPVVRAADGLPVLSATSELARSYPALFAFLTEATWEDGTPRETGTVMLLCGDGLLKAWLHDRNGGGSSAWAAGEALEDVFASADDMIASGSGEWRPDRAKAGARRPGRS